MPDFLATYDLQSTHPDPHTEFLNQATKNGWRLWKLSTAQNKWYRLPNTTLEGPFNNRDAAVAALKKTQADTAAALGRTVNMEKWIVVEYSGAAWNSDVTQPASS